jgi:hypothetical protein
VRFDLNGDANSIGGSFASGANYVYSNANGVASTAYIPGSRSSPTDGVTIRACWDYTDFPVGTCPNATTSSLTVTDEALSVTIGTDNTLQVGTEGLTYIKRFAVLVVDAAGQARADIQITPSIDLERYRKGEYGYVTTWTRDETPDAGFTFVCANEDVNRNGVLEASGPAGAEDVNSNGQLDPRKADVSIRVLGSSRTNSSGLAVVQIEYPKSHATWLEYNILVAAGGISGTEGRANYRGILPALATDAGSATVDPPFRRSPYGVTQSTYVTKQVSGTTLVNHDGSDQLFCTQQ